MNILPDLVDAIRKECRNAVKYSIYGTQDFHLEKVERIEDKGSAFNFRVTTWNDMSSNPRETKEMSLFEVMNLLGKVIGNRACNEACDIVKEFDVHN